VKIPPSPAKCRAKENIGGIGVQFKENWNAQRDTPAKAGAQGWIPAGAGMTI